MHALVDRPADAHLTLFEGTRVCIGFTGDRRVDVELGGRLSRRPLLVTLLGAPAPLQVRVRANGAQVTERAPWWHDARRGEKTIAVPAAPD
jgi:hypothetical protein